MALERAFLAGVDMNMGDYDGRTALHLACVENHPACVKYLIDACQVGWPGRAMEPPPGGPGRGGQVGEHSTPGRRPLQPPKVPGQPWEITVTSCDPASFAWINPSPGSWPC